MFWNRVSITGCPGKCPEVPPYRRVCYVHSVNFFFDPQGSAHGSEIDHERNTGQTRQRFGSCKFDSRRRSRQEHQHGRKCRRGRTSRIE
jgi:hypothetical protein